MDTKGDNTLSNALNPMRARIFSVREARIKHLLRWPLILQLYSDPGGRWLNVGYTGMCCSKGHGFFFNRFGQKYGMAFALLSFLKETT